MNIKTEVEVFEIVCFFVKAERNADVVCFLVYQLAIEFAYFAKAINIHFFCY
jgi:hypothetical protein